MIWQLEATFKCNHSSCTDDLPIAFFCVCVGDRYVDRVLASEKEKMKCCDIEYRFTEQHYQAFIYGGILIAGFFVYFVVIFFSSPLRW